MKKTKLGTASLVLTAAIALSACGGTAGKSASQGVSQAGTTAQETSGEAASAASQEAIKDLITYEIPSKEQEGFFILNTESSNDLTVLCNLYSELLEVDSKGQLQPAIAKEWGSEDGGLTWTFKLRDDVKWVDINGDVKADCTAQDWVTAMEWILNFHKNGGNNASMLLSMIRGAQDYYDYTKNLSPEEAKALDTSKLLEMVGIEAPDNYTLIYHCAQPTPYFDTVATSACMYPASQALIDQLGVDNVIGMTNETMWYNGPYFETSFIMNNEKVLTANPQYWDTDAALFDTVTIRMVDSTLHYQLWENGELDSVALSEADLRTIYNDPDNPDHDYLTETRPKKFSYQLHFNYDKKTEDGSSDDNWNLAAANEAFRLSFSWGLDLTSYWARTNFIYPLHNENLAYTMKGVAYYSDGTDYTDKVTQLLGLSKDGGDAPRRYDPEKAKAYKEQAMEELTAKGVSFPIQMDYYIISGDQNALDTATVLKQIFAECLGSDYVNLNIKTYVSSLSKEVFQPGLASFYISGWAADFGDPSNFLDQERYGYDGAYYSKNYSRINNATDADLIAAYKEFSDLAEKAGAISDLDARYDAYAQAEACLISHALTIPINYEVSWQLTKVNDYSKKYAMFGAQNYLYKNWETSATPYTTAQYQAFQAAAEKN